ncbi:hypothetical protein GCM10025867_25110 [Frondihabitans sucicola]|uniref:YihY/virulence factor BrkB family protein n=1 Tax=Frondihabitans sucicola TaxID=1268041 RepID=A0ABN6Y2U1_9MICO|nr:YihY/virulence factor BrkB family protein [Frondihabitans sucicola]BDZ50270.1 hypothetical protein GCM10025867_25110 [Frondihabitans sucicola]
MPTTPLDRFFGWLFELFPVRVFLAFGSKNGFVLAAGLAYQALFALFAALWSGFSVAGLALSGSPELRDSLFDVINTSVPGLIKSGNDATGAIDATKLLHAGIFGFTGAVAVVVLVFTAVGFLGSARGSVRAIFGVPQSTEDFFVRKGKDLVLGLLFGVAVLLSSVLSLISTSSVRFLLGLLGADVSTFGGTILLRGVGLVIVFAFDTVVLMGLFKVLSGLFIPRRRLVAGSLLGAAALGVLKAVGGVLLGHATTNPLLASFAVIVGLLIFLNLVCQVLLLTASWIAVQMAADGVLADPVAERARLAKLEAERQALIRSRALRAQPRWVRAASKLRARLPRRR